MRNLIQARLEALQAELEKGHIELQKVEAQRMLLHDTVLRIEGAIQVLKELADGHSVEEREVPSSEALPVSELTAPTEGH